MSQQLKTADVMVDFHYTMDMFFTHLGNTGSVSNANLMKIMTLALLDDYKDEILACNPSWKRIISDLENQLTIHC